MIEILIGGAFLTGAGAGALCAWLFGRKRWPKADRKRMKRMIARKEKQLRAYECCLMERGSDVSLGG